MNELLMLSNARIGALLGRCLEVYEREVGQQEQDISGWSRFTMERFVV